MRAPYRVAVWGPGQVSSTMIKELIQLPEYQIVGVLAYSDHKIGVDVGELMGMDPLGVKATGNRDEFMAIPADIVVYTAYDAGDGASDDDIIEILRSGKDVLTTLPYHNPKYHSSQEVYDRIEAACEEGQSTLFATGSFPGYFDFELISALSIQVSRVKHVHMVQYFDISGLGNPRYLETNGFGQPLREKPEDNPHYRFLYNYHVPMIQHMADEMGVTLDGIDYVDKSEVAEEDIEIKNMTIKRGTVATQVYDWVGMVGGKPFLTISATRYLGDAMQPKEAVSEMCWVVTVEGTPSYQMTIDLKRSFENDIKFDFSNIDFSISGVLMSKSIAATIEAPPGIKLAKLNERAWREDMRTAVAK